ncbi:hypothetical protein L13192_12779 [Pyrenophora tritici-repentis]|nr:hypothetical protein L13192_12779 [Pyrenophora tritici-repentis]
MPSKTTTLAAFTALPTTPSAQQMDANILALLTRSINIPLPAVVQNTPPAKLQSASIASRKRQPTSNTPPTQVWSAPVVNSKRQRTEREGCGVAMDYSGLGEETETETEAEVELEIEVEAQDTETKGQKSLILRLNEKKPRVYETSRSVLAVEREGEAAFTADTTTTTTTTTAGPALAPTRSSRRKIASKPKGKTKSKTPEDRGSVGAAPEDGITLLLAAAQLSPAARQATAIPAPVPAPVPDPAPAPSATASSATAPATALARAPGPRNPCNTRATRSAALPTLAFQNLYPPPEPTSTRRPTTTTPKNTPLPPAISHTAKAYAAFFPGEPGFYEVEDWKGKMVWDNVGGNGRLDKRGMFM